ncbi:hypothetical protein N9V96_02700, partial [Polaribacter sp.]|nr:hypothetical protein [Polaribacter sp.]
EVQESDNQGEKTPTTKLERIPKIVANYETPEFISINLDTKTHNSFYLFSVKTATYSPPTPPPKC